MARSTFGSVRERSKGVWEISYHINGKRKYETVRGSRKLAESRLAELRLKYDGAFSDYSNLTVAMLWDAIVFPGAQARVKDTTSSSYRGLFNNHLREAIGDKLVVKVTRDDIQKLLLSKTRATASHLKNVLWLIFREAHEREITSKNIMSYRYELPERPKTSKQSDGIYTIDELNIIFEACRGEIWEAAYILAAFGGLRRSEACSFKAGEFKYIDGAHSYATAQITRTIVYVDKSVQIREGVGKTQASLGTVVVPDPYASRLMELQAEALERGDVWLIDDGLGMPSNPMLIAKSYARWFQTQPYRYIPYKNLRNSYATALHESGIDIGMIAKMLRHSTPNVTFKHYDKPSESAFANAAANLSRDSGWQPLSPTKSKNDGKIIDFQNRDIAAR